MPKFTMQKAVADLNANHLSPHFRKRDILRLAILIGLILILALPTLTYPLGRDQGVFAVIGRGLLDGRVPYVDLWDPKPPAVFYIYAGAMMLFGRTVMALRAIDLLMFPVIALCLYWLGRRWKNARVGEWAVILFGVFYFTETFWTLTQNDGIALLPLCLAAVCALKAVEAGRWAWLWSLACGALCGWVFWFKYPFGLFIAVMFIGYLELRPSAPAPNSASGENAVALLPRAASVGWNRRAAILFAFISGLFAVLLGGVLNLASIGALDALVESARVTAGYTALGFDADEFMRALNTALPMRVAWIGLVGLALIGSIPQKTADSNRQISLMLRRWLIAALGILIVQAKFYDYHWLPLLPALVMFGAAGIERVITFVDNRVRSHAADAALRGTAAALFLAVLAVVIGTKTIPYLTGQEDQTTYFARFQAGEFIADESLKVADFLRARVVPGDSLFIWGFRPEVYYLSQLKPAVRFIFHYPLVADWYPRAWRDQTVDILWAALPPYVLVLQVDYLDWVTGRADADSNTLLQEYTDLNDWLIFNYERETRIGNFFVWRRKK